MTAPISRLTPAELADSVRKADALVLRGLGELGHVKESLQQFCLGIQRLKDDGMPLADAMKELLFDNEHVAADDQAKYRESWANALLACAEVVHAILVRTACRDRLAELAGHN